MRSKTGGRDDEIRRGWQIESAATFEKTIFQPEESLLGGKTFRPETTQWSSAVAGKNGNSLRISCSLG